MLLNEFILRFTIQLLPSYLCHSRTINNKINILHEICLRMVYNSKKLSFKELLETDKSVPIHIKNLQVLATEIIKVYRNISPPIVRQLCQLKNNDYNLWVFKIWFPKCRKCFCGTESFLFLGSKIWHTVPNAFKKETSPSENCPCRLCKSYIPNLGFTYNFFSACIWLLLL